MPWMVDEKPPIPRNDPRAVAWIRSIILKFRARQATVEKGHQKYLRGMEPLHGPSQAFHIWVRSPEILDNHLIIFTCSRKLPDVHIESFGPIGLKQVLEVYDYIDEMPNLREPAEHARSRGLVHVRQPDRPDTIMQHLDSYLTGFYHNLRSQAFNLHAKDIRVLPNAPTRNASVWTFHGDLFSNSPAEVIDPFFEEAKNNFERVRAFRRERRSKRVPAPAEYSPDDWEGYYAFLYPSFVIGRRPEMPIRERIFGGWLGGPGRVILTLSTGGTEFFAMRSGAVGVVVPDREGARFLLNLVACELNRIGKECHYLRDRDLAGFRRRLDDRTGQREFTSWSFPDRFYMGRQREEEPNLFTNRTWIPEKTLQRAIQKAVSARRKKEASARLLVFEAETHLREKAFRQSFFLSWIVVETTLYGLWEKLLGQLRGRAREKIKAGPEEWNVAPVTRALMLAGRITPALGGQVLGFNMKRNRYLHGDAAPTESDASGILEVSKNLVPSAMGKPAKRRRPGRSVSW